MEYVISGENKYVCVKGDGSIYICGSIRKAYRTSNLADLISVYDRLAEQPFLYYKATWALEDWETA